jgi:Rrf2 family protein
MVSQTAKYTLHILGYLVTRREHLVRGSEIAEATGIPANYLSKILSQLRKGGVVEAQKGWGGGFRLRDGAIDRPVREVLEIIDGADRVERVDCVFGLPRCDAERPCPLHDQWQTVRTLFNRMLADTRLCDLGLDRGG